MRYAREFVFKHVFKAYDAQPRDIVPRSILLAWDDL